ncbi:MAG: sulfotransferase, partial [Sphingomonadaceae bacterium]|nr:sulfotransferase [Sphingomonadaceae bacterium]
SAVLAAETLIAEAETVTGLADWGGRRWSEERFRHDLSVLCAAIEATAEVTELGRSRTHTRLFTMLVSRLRYIEARKATAGVDDQRIVAPLIGTGLPRAGTTFFHGVIAQDPANRVARAYEAAIPVPLDDGETDERIALYQQILDYQGTTHPDVTQIHPFGAALPEECIFLQEADCASLYNVYWNVPAYQQAVADKTPSAYRWQLGMMQYLQAVRPGGRWALKAPGHMFTWAEMQIAFPDALIYVNHRDPGKIVPSIATLFRALRGLFSDRGYDPLQLGLAQLQMWEAATSQYTDWRSGPGKDAKNVVDIHFAELTARPLETVARVYDQFGIALTAAARDAMERHIEADHHGKGPGRVYTLAEFGLSEAQIDRTFARYMDHFGIKREKRA